VKNVAFRSDLRYLLLALVFTAATVACIDWLRSAPIRRLDLLLFATSAGALVSAFLWLFLIALEISRRWAFVMLAGFWIPYLNFVLASIFARRYWERGARGPAWLGLLGLLGQSIASIRLLFPSVPSLV